MDQNVAINIVLEKIRLHLNPIESGWSFSWLKNGTYRTLGQCNYHLRHIRLNHEWVGKASDVEVLDVILHEIAHALAYYRCGRVRQGHNHIWRDECRKIGADPKRCKNSDVKLENNRKVYYDLVNTATGEKYQRYYRRPTKLIRNSSCIFIVGRKEATMGKLAIVDCNGKRCC